MLQELLKNQKNYTDHFFSSLDLPPIENLIQKLMACKGMIFFSGVGKSGFVAQKIAYTMVSTGTKAFYLSPTDALHGDLGMVSSEDMFMMFSKSGESEELLNLIPAIKNKGATLVAVVCNPQSSLATASHMTVSLPFTHELCPFDIAPTISTTIQIMFGDLLTVALMKHKNFSLNEYALNHPSGRIGKRMNLYVRDLMLTGDKIPCGYPHHKISDVLIELTQKRCGCVLIANPDHTLAGIFTDGDLRRNLQRMGNEILSLTVEQLMCTHPKVITPDVLAWDAMKLMEADPSQRLMMLPVVDQNRKIVGLIHLHDILQSGI